MYSGFARFLILVIGFCDSSPFYPVIVCLPVAVNGYLSEQVDYSLDLLKDRPIPRRFCQFPDEPSKIVIIEVLDAWLLGKHT